jgi:cytochrome c oxidase cbb3-type subunit 3
MPQPWCRSVLIVMATLAALGGSLAASAAARSQAGAPRAASAPGRKPLTDAASLAQGRALYEGQTFLCANCHRPDLGGLIGPNLVDDYWASGCSVDAIITATEQGFPARGMMPFGSGKPMTPTQLHQLASYMISKRGSAPPGAKAHDPAREKICK